MTRTKTRGTCALCGYESTKAGITRHLKTCPGTHDGKAGKATKLWQLRIQDAYSPLYWLDLEVKTGATLAAVDAYLREVWLECCGHLSAFDINGERYGGSHGGVPGGFDLGEKSLNVKLSGVLSPDLEFTHEYDFGSTTELTLKVTGEREGRVGPAPLRRLARNDAPTWPCRVCGEPATQLHTEMYDEENPFYCDLHRDLHAAQQGDEWAFLPVVNSPRMGVCGYTGPAA